MRVLRLRGSRGGLGERGLRTHRREGRVRRCGAAVPISSDGLGGTYSPTNPHPAAAWVLEVEQEEGA